jgi:hypothetical protein
VPVPGAILHLLRADVRKLNLEEGGGEEWKEREEKTTKAFHSPALAWVENSSGEWRGLTNPAAFLFGPPLVFVALNQMLGAFGLSRLAEI